MKNLAKVIAFLGCALFMGEMSVVIAQLPESTLFRSNVGPLATTLAIDQAGNLYGMSTGDSHNGGSVYELVHNVNHTFTFKSLYTFGANGSGDGLNPASTAGLIIDSEGNLYGTTTAGGADGKGSVFEISPGSGGTWTEKVLYSFGENASADGKGIPNGGLVMDSRGNLYGSTTEGGVSSTGSVFELSLGSGSVWQETVLYSFPDNNGGSQMISPLVFDKNGDILGALQSGNLSSAIFELMPSSGDSWAYSTAYDFTPASGQINLSGNLAVDKSGNIYGTYVWSGGPAGSNLGTVYELSPASNSSWTQTAIYNFGQYDIDGAFPLGGVTIDALGNLFATTEQGGGGMDIGGVYELMPGQDGTWLQFFIYSFSYFASGKSVVWEPQGNVVVDSAGNLYGTLTHLAKGQATATDDGEVFGIEQPTIGGPEVSFAAPPYRVSISCPPSTITHYTLDGTEPMPASPVYTGPFILKMTTTVSAVCVGSNNAESFVISSIDVVPPVPNPPNIIPPSGTYASPQNLLITQGAQPNAENATFIYYTTDGSDPITVNDFVAQPTPTAKLYTDLVTIAQSETVKAATLSSALSSSIVTATYNIASPIDSSYPAGAISASQLVLNGGAQVISGQLHLTGNSGPPEARSAWFNTKVYVGGFITDFDFQQYDDGELGDGFTFTVQNQGPKAVGSAAAGLGYEGITKSVAVKFDLYNLDIGGVTNTTGLYTNGAQPTVPAVSLAGNLVDLTNGHPMHAHITYDGTKLILSITDLNTGANQTHNFPVNIPQVVGADTAYIGFTGSTGDGADRQNITSWSYLPLGSSTASLDFPGAVSTVLRSIDAGGNIAGYYLDASAATHAFTRDSFGKGLELGTNGKYTFSHNEIPMGIDNSGVVIGPNFVISPDGTVNTVSLPLAAINDSSMVIGTDEGSTAKGHGFLRKCGFDGKACAGF